MSVTANTLVVPETSPTSPESLWGPGNIFLTDWTNGCEITTTWPGTIGSGSTSAEKRVQATSRPIRTVRFTLRARNRQESWAIKNLLLRMGQCRTLLPLYPDYIASTAAANAGATTIPVDDSTHRRFFVGGRLLIFTPTPTLATNVEAAVISSVSGTSIGVAALTANHSAGSRVVPAIECDVWPASNAVVKDGLLSVLMLAREISGESALSALANPGDSFGFQTSGGVPVFDLGPRPDLSWRELTSGWRRDARVSKIGQGSSYELLGSRPRAVSSRQVQAISRATAWKLLQFFDASRGQTFPFFSAEAIAYFKPTAITATTLAVPSVGPLEDWQNYPYLMLLTPAGLTVIPISGVTRDASIDTITFASITPPALASIICATVGHLMRFDSPDMVEQWKTSANLTLKHSLVEVLDEGAIAIDNLDSGGGGGSGTLPSEYSYHSGSVQGQDNDASVPIDFVSSTQSIACGSATNLIFDTSNDDLVVMIRTTASVTASYSTPGSSGGVFTVTLPADCVILDASSGFTNNEMDITDGTHSYSLTAGGTLIAAALVSAGFHAFSSGDAIPLSLLHSLGMADTSGNVSFKFVLVPGGYGFININSASVS